MPKAFDEDYISLTVKHSKKEHIDLILPTSSNEIITISKHSHFFFDSLGVQLFMSDYESIMICTDKLKFYEKCRDKFPLPKTNDRCDIDDLPLEANQKYTRW